MDINFQAQESPAPINILEFVSALGLEQSEPQSQPEDPKADPNEQN